MFRYTHAKSHRSRERREKERVGIMTYTLSQDNSAGIARCVASQLQSDLSTIICHMPDSQTASFSDRWQWAHQMVHLWLHGGRACHDASPLEELEANWGAHTILWPDAMLVKKVNTFSEHGALARLPAGNVQNAV